MNAGVIVEQPLADRALPGGRRLGTIEEGYASTLSPGDHFYFSGLSLEVEQFKDTDIIVRASSKRARIVTYGGQRMSMSTHLANRVRHMLADRNDWAAFPTTSANGSRFRSGARSIPEPERASGRNLRARRACTTWSPTASRAGTRTSRSEC
jgi:ATP-dependent helicase Lhr and Lhr-like helicase